MRIDDTLAHGYAHQVLRDLTDSCRRQADRVIGRLQHDLGRPVVRKARARKLVRQACDDLGDFVLADYRRELKRIGPAAVWIIPGDAVRDGLSLNRLHLIFAGPRHRATLHIEDLAFISDHTLARMLQRIPDATPETLMDHLRAMTIGLCLARMLVVAHGWQQWCVPVATGSVVGYVEADGYLVSTTFLPEDHAGWAPIRDAMSHALARLREQPAVLTDALIIGVDASRVEELRLLADLFVGTAFLRLQVPHARPDGDG